MKNDLLYIDLFAGCGGLSLGLHNSGWHGFFAVEKNQDAFKTLEHNLIQKKNHFTWPDWLEQAPNDIYDLIKNHRDELSSLSGKISLVVGGPPCQGFSMAGKRVKDDIRNKLVDAYIEFINIVRPKILFLENVHGFTVGFEHNKKRGKPYSLIVKESLENMGYKVNSKIIDVSKYGVPQSRKRFILVGTILDNPTDFFEDLENSKENFLDEKNIQNIVTIEEAIGDLLKANGTYKLEKMKNFDFGKYGRSTSNYQRLMRTGSSKYPDSHRFANHNYDTVRIFRELMEKTNRMTRVTPSMNLVEGFKKRGVTLLKKGYVCSTITSIPDDFIHYSEPRILTVREMARVQSFPDWFEFCGKYTTGGQLRKKDVPRYTQVANAVPPLFAEQVGIILKNMIQ
ncbi:MAG: DNA cytosine methyltransferase [Bacilli bacterium]|nr:DNA cytosine methyltransferase [Bacilli bacterium]